MCDNNMKTNNSGSSGANSPVLNGTMSPLHPASPALSPNSSMNGMCARSSPIRLICTKEFDQARSLNLV